MIRILQAWWWQWRIARVTARARAARARACLATPEAPRWRKVYFALESELTALERKRSLRLQR